MLFVDDVAGGFVVVICVVCVFVVAAAVCAGLCMDVCHIVAVLLPVSIIVLTRAFADFVVD